MSNYLSVQTNKVYCCVECAKVDALHQGYKFTRGSIMPVHLDEVQMYLESQPDCPTCGELLEESPHVHH